MCLCLSLASGVRSSPGESILYLLLDDFWLHSTSSIVRAVTCNRDEWNLTNIFSYLSDNRLLMGLFMFSSVCFCFYTGLFMPDWAELVIVRNFNLLAIISHGVDFIIGLQAIKLSFCIDGDI